METIKQALSRAVHDLYDVEVEPELTRPAEQFGDYATNVALQLAGKVGKPPREVAEALVAKLASPDIASAEVAGPGFINITLSDQVLMSELVKVSETYGRSDTYKDKTVVAEYSDPNPFKILHAGHLYTCVVGDALANLFAIAGATVHRVNYGGDVGLHVGKTMWAILRRLGGEHPDKLADIAESQRAEWLAEAYVEGSNAYEDDEQAKQAINALNKQVYELQSKDDHESSLAQIYWTTRQWSYDYFNSFYNRLGTSFEKYYPESTVTAKGLATVKEQLQKGVFQESDGAIIFPGEDHDLHTRVFINSQGLPTYEAKDVGLILTKWEEYHFDVSLIITGNEQAQYMRVVLKALEQFEPELASRTIHLTHGILKLKGGVKMSSRKGNILRAVDVLDAAAEANKQLTGKEQSDVILGAVKYAFLKQSIGPDIIYDPAESVAIQGNSGPYLQYAHARARSILAKAVESKPGRVNDLQPAERSLLRKIGEYPEVIQAAVTELMPHHVCTYLYELAQVFNQFYEKNRVLGDARESLRLQLVQAYAQVLKNGLEVLNISAPERL